MAEQKRGESPAWIGLGSNIGNGVEQLAKAWQRLGEFPEIRLKTISSPWFSSPVDMESENWFTNAVGRLQTTLPPKKLLTILHQVESELGRKRDKTKNVQEGQKQRVYHNRTLDLDLLYYGKNGDLVVEENNLILPHPRRCERLFVLKPLQEIEPNFFDSKEQNYIIDMIYALEKNLAENQQSIFIKNWQHF